MQMLLSNFRDIGGSPVPGGRIATGTIFRSAAPGRVPEEVLRHHGIIALIDLRATGECDTRPTVLHNTDCSIIATPIEPRASGRLREMIADGTATRAALHDLMVDTYRSFVLDSAADFGRAVEALTTSRGPTLLHCTAGKDRTGFIVAVLQRALGASNDAVLTDYMRTNQDWDRRSAPAHLSQHSEALEPILVAHHDYLAAAFDAIAKRDGSVEAFIARATAGRVDAPDLARFIVRENVG